MTTEKLPLLRIKLYIKLLEIFPEIEDYDLVTRGKKQGLIDDIYEIGNSVNSQKLNKVTDFLSVRHVDTDDLLTSDGESNGCIVKDIVLPQAFKKLKLCIDGCKFQSGKNPLRKKILYNVIYANIGVTDHVWERITRTL